MWRSCHFMLSIEITVWYCRLNYDIDFIMTWIGNAAALKAVPVPVVSDGYTASLWLSITPTHQPVEVQRSFTCPQESPCQFLNTFTTVNPAVDVPSDWNKHMSNAECCFVLWQNEFQAVTTLLPEIYLTIFGVYCWFLEGYE